MSYRLALCAALLISADVVHAADSPTTVADLRCEHRDNPLGVEVARPRLSWRLISKVRGQKQTAYQITASDERGPLWDSGRVASEQSVLVEWAGKPLAPRQRVEWKVRVWDKDGVAVDSAPARFEMGLGDARKWRGGWVGRPTSGAPQGFAPDRQAMRWIWYPDEGDLTVKAPAGERSFRKSFTIPEGAKVKWALLGVAADGNGRVKLNGKDVGRSPGIASLKPLVLTPYLQPGENVLELIGSNGSDAAGVLAQARVELEGGRPIVLSTDGTWTSSKDGGSWVPAKVLAKPGEGQFWKELRTDQVRLAWTEPPAYLRKAFDVASSPVRRARLYATAKGLYELAINGRRVGDQVLAPGWTAYDKRINYQTYDVTTLVKAGRNAMGAILADGWYTGKVGFSGRNVYGGYPLGLLANLVIEHEDGSTEVIATDKSWKATTGPLLAADLQDGERYDARKELGAWTDAAYDDASWTPVAMAPVDPRGPRLVADPSVPVRVTEELRPTNVTEPRPGTFVFDLGQNFSGWARLSVQGTAGTTVQLRFGEMLNPDGTLYTENLRDAEATDRYTLRGTGGVETWEPRFSFHGFRYVEVTGYPGRPTRDAIVGRVVHSDTPKTGTFSSSSRMVNQLVKNIDWGQRSNFLSVPTDCPQRDERLGWMGDAQIFVRTAALGRDVSAFFTKWLADVRDAQSPQGAFSDVVPRAPGTLDGAPAWGDAGVIVPWVVYEQYGDRRLLEESYPSMVRWVEHIRRENPDLLWKKARGNDYGDWLSIGADTSKDVLATAYFAGTTALVARAAEALGRKADATKHQRLFEKIRAAFQRAHVAPDGRITSDTQTAYVLALRFDLLPVELRAQAAKHLVADIEKRGNHLSTGFLGVGHLLPVLTEIGRVDVAYRLLETDTFPSWGYSIKHGATTIWERWDGWTKEKGFQTPGMNSFNHYSLGSVGEWLYQSVAGLAPAAPGWKRLRIEPRPGGSLTQASAEVTTPYGKAASRWESRGKELRLAVVVPPNTTATVKVPGGKGGAIDGATFVRQEADGAVYEVAAGAYEFTGAR